MEELFNTKLSLRKFQIVFATGATFITCFFFIIFQTFYSISVHQLIDPVQSQKTRDRVQTQFEFKDDKHLYLYDVPYFMDKSIIIAGMVHNVEDHIKPLLKSLNEIYCIFNNTIFLIFESNSNDATPQILDQWSLNKNTNEFCVKYKFNKKRQKNSLFNPRKTMNDDITTESLQKHKPSLVDKIAIHNDDIVINDLLKLQQSLRKPMNGSINLNRIERYTVYRNMMLHKVKSIRDQYLNSPWNIKFDYLMLIDLDLFALDIRMIFNELYYSPTNIMCANGVVWNYDLMYDIFAAVKDNGQWMMDPNINNKQKGNIKLSTFPHDRFEAMRSCFNGITFYKSLDELLDTNCKYQLILSTQSNKDIDNDNEYIMKYPSEELQKFADMYQEWKLSDDRICEHLSFNYCLRENGYNISISTKAKAYYSQRLVKRPMNKPKKKKKELNKLPTLRNKRKHP